MKVLTKPRGLFLIFAISTLLGAGVSAQTPYEISIQVFHEALQGVTVSVPVVKAAGSEAIWGFDFLMTFDTVTLSLTGVTPGEMFDMPGAYEWEYFEFRVDTVSGYAGLLRAVALANTNDGPHLPLNMNIPDGTTLFTLDFAVTDDSAYNCTYNPIRFYWMDCGDNAIAPDSLGQTLAVSDGVYDWVGEYMDISDPYGSMPGYFGAPESCTSDPSVIRMIDFYNGGVDIHCTEEPDYRGDLNCNGIGHEIADYIIFTNYFLNGLSAFDGHIECSSHASDVNADGTGLRVEDLIYLYQTIIGAAVPYPTYPAVVPHDSIAVTFVQDDDTKTISLDYAESLAGINLTFDGEVTPTSLTTDDGILLYSVFDGEYTRVLISPDLGDTLPDFITGGIFLTYTGSALLIEAGAADYDDHVFSVIIENTGSGLTIPFAFEIGMIPDANLGQHISIPVIKTAGSIPLEGFWFKIGYDAAAINIVDVTPGGIFDIPGDYQWQQFGHGFGPDDVCDDPICPSGLLRVVGLADAYGEMALEKDIPNGTVLFTIEAEVTSDLTFSNLLIPIRFFWDRCVGNEIPYYDSTGVNLMTGVSDHVYDYNGLEITDPEAGVPGYYGVPDSCDYGARFVNLTNGAVHIGPIENMKLIVNIDSVSAQVGDTDIYVDIHLSNPQDTIVGFTLYIQLDRPDLVEFGRSPDDTTAVDVSGTLIGDWEYIEQRSFSPGRHDLKITAISNTTPPFDKGIAPRMDGILCRLVLHAYDEMPPVFTDSTVHLMINEMPSLTSFSDPNGVTIGIDGGAYDFQVVSFLGGAVTVYDHPVGDANGDKYINVGDIVYLVAYIFKGGPAPVPLTSGDVNCDGNVNVADAVYLVNFVFKSGPAPGDGC